MTDVRSDSALDDPLRDVLQTVFIDLVVSFIDGEIKAVRSIDLDIQEPWAEIFVSLRWLTESKKFRQKLSHPPEEDRQIVYGFEWRTLGYSPQDQWSSLVVPF